MRHAYTGFRSQNYFRSWSAIASAKTLEQCLYMLEDEGEEVWLPPGAHLLDLLHVVVPVAHHVPPPTHQ
jgi:hypothetical protein